jgi:hypothetical protein
LDTSGEPDVHSEAVHHRQRRKAAGPDLSDSAKATGYPYPPEGAQTVISSDFTSMVPQSQWNPDSFTPHLDALRAPSQAEA